MNLQTAAINIYIQYQLRAQRLQSVGAVEAAKWLNNANILKDSKSKPGLPLRNKLRGNEIVGQFQENNKHCFIEHVILTKINIEGD